MKHPASRLLIAALGGVALMLAASEGVSTPAAAQARSAAAARPMFRPTTVRAIAHHRRARNASGYVYWPDGTYGDHGADGAVSGEPGVDVAAPSGDVHYTYTYDAPWDAVHRLPPNVVPGPRPYVSDCTTQVVTVPRRGDPGQTANINITRCY